MRLRLATPADAENIHAWRNSPEVRQFSLDSREIAWDEHLAWFTRTLEDVARQLLIAEKDGEPCGVLRFDFRGDLAEVSVFLDPARAGQGLGTEILKKGTEWLRQNFPAVKKLQARIKPDNPASQRAFAKAGYGESWRVYELNLNAHE